MGHPISWRSERATRSLLVADGYSVYTSAGPQLISNEENTMRWMTMVSSAAVLVAVAGVARLARAEEVPIGAIAQRESRGDATRQEVCTFPPVRMAYTPA